ncbi:MAG TPA: hypothetical protein VK578_24745 [Edaphobacter sp.]|jgi:hypothetical protein|nr:hypothetical protein [Edaphobacter sp.]
MDLDLLLLSGFYGLVCFVGCGFFYQRWRWRRRKRLGRSQLGFYPGGAALGNALHQLQVLAEPRVAYVVEEKLDEEADEEAEGGPDDPVRHLHRQAARIRKGEKLERLTALFREGE